LTGGQDAAVLVKEKEVETEGEKKSAGDTAQRRENNVAPRLY
jgi:hypothetical protein